MTDRWEQVRAEVEGGIAEGVFPGAGWGVLEAVEPGSPRVTVGAAGGFTYEAASPAVTPETRWDLASVSKVVGTTAMAMLLWQRGELALEQPVGDVLPDFRMGGKDRVTVGHLLAHNSGLPGYARLFATCDSPAELLAACMHMELTAAPGERAEYSDIGFIVLGRLLEVVAGETLDSWLAREVFKPLGMAATGYNPLPAEQRAIPPTEVGPGNEVIQGVVHDENCRALGGVAGHAGLFAPVGDVLRFAGAMLGGELFHPDTVAQWTRQVGLPEGSSRALGWDTPSGASSSGRWFSPRSFGHLGYTGTSLWIDGQRGVAVVLLTNRTWPTRANDRIKAFRPRFHDAVMGTLLRLS